MKNIFKAYAKINLLLRVLNKRPDGFHNIQSLMSKISLCDEIRVKELSKASRFTMDLALSGCALSEDVTGLELDRNIVYRAAVSFSQKSKIPFRFHIELEKNIPSGAGLGGGSADAALVLNLLNKAFPVLSAASLKRLALKLGADVPFCMQESQMLVEGIGEKLRKPGFAVDAHVVLVHPVCIINTKNAYNELDRLDLKNLHLSRKSLKRNFVKSGIVSFGNDFEKVVFDGYPELDKIKNELKKSGAFFSQMTGSGSTVFGLYNDEFVAKKAYCELSKMYSRVTISKLRS